MAYLVLDPTCDALMRELREMDRQRDHLRARLADAAMHVELAEVDRNLPWYSCPEFRAQMKAKNEEAIRERIAVRARRREKEMRLFGAYVRPGTWDADLDKYQEPSYEEELADGYGIRLVRARDLTWNAYVLLPAGHVAQGKHYDFFAQEAPAGLPHAPQYLTYNAVEDGRGVFGFYLTNVVKPREEYGDYDRYNYYSVEQTGKTYLDDGSLHVSYEKMRARCLGLVEYFKGLTSPENARFFGRRRVPSIASLGLAPPDERPEVLQLEEPPAQPKPKKSWAAVVAGR